MTKKAATTSARVATRFEKPLVDRPGDITVCRLPEGTVGAEHENTGENAHGRVVLHVSSLAIAGGNSCDGRGQRGDIKAIRRSMKKLLDQDVRLLAGFLGKRTHPLLQKEAKRMLEQSGQVPRKMQIQRH